MAGIREGRGAKSSPVKCVLREVRESRRMESLIPPLGL